MFTGCIFRFLNLATLPNGIWVDEAKNGVDALISLHEGQLKIVYTRFFPREGLYVWLLTVTHFFIEPSQLALRLPAAITGCLTIITTYFMSSDLSRQSKLANKQESALIGLIAAALISTLYLHINFSRIAFRAILDPFFITLTTSLIIRSLRPNSNKLFSLFTGVIAGFGILGYIAYKSMFIAYIFLIFSLIIRYKYKTVKQGLLLILGTIIGTLPLVTYIFLYPSAYFKRLEAVTQEASGFQWDIFLSNFILIIKSIWGDGDPNGRHNLDAMPILPLALVVFLAIGFITIVVLTIHKRLNNILIIFVGLSLISTVSISAISIGGQPHALRSIGVLIPVIFIVAVGIERTMQVIKFNSAKAQLMTLTIVLLYLSANTYHNYFVKFKEKSGAHFQKKINQYILELIHSEGPKTITIYDADDEFELNILLYYTANKPKTHNIEIKYDNNFKKR